MGWCMQFFSKEKGQNYGRNLVPWVSIMNENPLSHQMMCLAGFESSVFIMLFTLKINLDDRSVSLRAKSSSQSPFKSTSVRRHHVI